jgi:serum/glucocorticoid-regulated kinase 2
LYAAEILLALERLHEVDPSYYELKPKHILLDSVGHVVLCDLGFLRLETTNMEKTTDVTMDYLAPELLSGHISATTVTTASNWWTLGSFLFEMLTGLPPFYDQDPEQRLQNILSEEPFADSKYLSESAEDLLSKLLSRKP